MKYIVAIDIGGTTFNTGIFSESLNEIFISNKDKIRYYDGKEQVVDAIIKQVNTAIDENNIIRDDILGVGIASPGPLDSKKGIILNTPNLKIFQNYKIVNDFTKKLKIDTFIENDANLFSLGEWYSQYRKNSVIIGVTLGTGLGFGMVINGKLFTGGSGLAMEYGLSPFDWGLCEEAVCIRYIRKRAKELYGEELSPRVVEEYYPDDKKAVQIYDEYGRNLGIVLSHIVNMIDPQIITIGGGLSKAFKCFEDSMRLTLKKHAPSFNLNPIVISQSILRERSTMLGASMLVKNAKDKESLFII
jgi:glucokinase